MDGLEVLEKIQALEYDPAIVMISDTEQSTQPLMR